MFQTYIFNDNNNNNIDDSVISGIIYYILGLRKLVD